MVENLVMKHESKAWCCGHLRQRIKVLHPVIFYNLESRPCLTICCVVPADGALYMLSCSAGVT